MMRIHRLAAAALSALLCGHILVRPVAAEAGQSTFNSRRSLGIVFIGGSLFLTKQGFDFRSEADGLYEKYQKAGTAEEADRLYTRTNNRDVKSQVSWALATAFALSGTRLLLAKGDSAPRMARGVESSHSKPGFALEPQIEIRRLGFRLKRRFF